MRKFELLTILRVIFDQKKSPESEIQGFSKSIFFGELIGHVTTNNPAFRVFDEQKDFISFG